jgi:hypothetical protein
MMIENQGWKSFEMNRGQADQYFRFADEGALHLKSGFSPTLSATSVL